MTDDESRLTDLLCANCDYNLTGLTENRCPECGNSFDPAELQRLLRNAPAPKGLTALVIQVLWPAAVFPSVLGLVAVAGPRWLFGTWAITLVVTLVVNSMVALDGFLALSKLRAGRAPYAWSSPGRSIVVFVFVFVAQLMLTALASVCVLRLAFG
jgi:hypothetical protein